MTAKPRDPAIRVALMPKDTNALGTIFGGVILSHLDIAAAIEARRHAPQRTFVTVAMNRVVFDAPVYVGDLVSFYTETTKVGRTSVTVRVQVEAERLREPGKRVQVMDAEVVYVAVDDKRRPVPLAAAGDATALPAP
ncbi:MAG TPA: hotdog domain-containing protein [Planctomycetota bacterium]|nr:hotdog domain-containing protein [Planctomycetota bacterium]